MANVEVKGLRELGQALEKFPHALARKYLRRAVFKATQLIQQEAVIRAPFRTGVLSQNIVVARSRDKKATSLTEMYKVIVRPIRLNAKAKKVLRILKKATGKRTSIQGDPFYWRFHEFGTQKMAARPFLRPAFETQKDSALEVLKRELSQGVAKAAKEVAAK